MLAFRWAEGCHAQKPLPGVLPAGRIEFTLRRREGEAGARLASVPEAGTASLQVFGPKTMSAAGGLRRRARLSRLVSFSASHRLHRWGLPTCVTARAGLALLRSWGAWPRA